MSLIIYSFDLHSLDRTNQAIRQSGGLCN